MKLLDGKKLAQLRRDKLKSDVEAFKAKHNITPGLGVILVGDDPASHVYVNNKHKACMNVGMNSIKVELSKNASPDEVFLKIDELNDRKDVHGFLVQMPVPEQINTTQVLATIDPLKDADGLTNENLGLMFAGQPRVCPCTPQGIIEILKYYDVPTEGKSAVVIGRSNIVGKPMAALLTSANATVTVCHSKTPNTAELASRADIVVVAAGQPEYFGKEYFKTGATVIDVGIHRKNNGKLCGDVKFDEVKNHVGAITPVPGGVGPMTIAMLLENTFTLAKLDVELFNI